jgi:hypothetical protein
MDIKREELEALRLLRAFAKITDRDTRRMIVERAEKAVQAKPDEQPSR